MGEVYANNSIILITEIGETNTTSNTGLQCITDKIPCCLQGTAGQWYFPDGVTTVPSLRQDATTFYSNRGDDGTINLNHINNVVSPTGRFCCVVPDASQALVRVCANISKLIIS